MNDKLNKEEKLKLLKHALKSSTGSDNLIYALIGSDPILHSLDFNPKYSEEEIQNRKDQLFSLID